MPTGADVAPVEAVGELGFMVTQVGLPFTETDAGKDHSEQLAQDEGSQIGSEQILEVPHRLGVLLDGRGIGVCRLQCCLPFVPEN